MFFFCFFLKSVIQDLLGPALCNLLCWMPLDAKMYQDFFFQITAFIISSRYVPYIGLNLCVSYVTSLGQFLAPLTQYSLRKSESPEHNCSMKAHLPAARSRFTISSAHANNANPVRVLTTLNFDFSKYKQRDYFSWVQHPAAQENMQSSREVINMGTRLSLQNREKTFSI